MESTSKIGKIIDRLEGPAAERRRLVALLEATAGSKRVSEAAAEIGLGTSQFHELRQRALAAALEAIAPRPAGRGAKRASARPPADALGAQGLADIVSALAFAAMRVLAIGVGHTPPEPASAADSDPVMVAILDLELLVRSAIPDPESREPADVDPRDGRLRQEARRQQEHEIRLRLLAYVRSLRDLGHAWAEIAERSGIPHSTLREWARKAERRELGPTARGRPPAGVALGTREAICETLALLGPRVSVNRLQQLFTDVPRRVLAHMRKRFRRVFRKRGRVLAWRLRWTCPRSVWAIDGLEPPAMLTGGLAKILVVRDLASGRILAGKAVAAEAGGPTRALLQDLYTSLGAPLVLKLDNGAGFTAQEVRDLCARSQVVLLYSPPRSPWYQGHIETGMSALRDAIDEIAARDGRAGHWTQADIDVAIRELNHGQEIAHAGASPAGLWSRAGVLSSTVREAFYRSYAKCAPGRDADAVAERTHIEEVLLDSGLLERRRVSVQRRTPKQGLIRHVAGQLGDVARALGRRFDEICSVLLKALDDSMTPGLKRQRADCTSDPVPDRQ